MADHDPTEARPEGMRTAAIIDTGLIVILVFGLFVGVVLVIRPFAVGLMFGAVIAIAAWPLRTRLCRAGLPPSLAALVLVVVILALILIPIASLAPTLDNRLKALFDVVHDWIQSSPPPPAWLAGLPLVGQGLADQWTAQFGRTGGLDLTGIATSARGAFLGVARGVGESLVQFVLALIVAGMFWAKGDAMAVLARRAFRRLGGERMDAIGLLIVGAVRGVFYGVVGTAIIQGLLMVVGLRIVGVPSSVPIGFITFLLAISQVGTVLIHLVWIGAAYWLHANGHSAVALWFVVIWGIGVAMADNFLKPLLIGQSLRMPLALVLVGVLGGFISFGFLGLFVGPVLIAIAWSLFGGWLGAENEMG